MSQLVIRPNVCSRSIFDKKNKTSPLRVFELIPDPLYSGGRWNRSRQNLCQIALHTPLYLFSSSIANPFLYPACALTSLSFCRRRLGGRRCRPAPGAQVFFGPFAGARRQPPPGTPHPWVFPSSCAKPSTQTLT